MENISKKHENLVLSMDRAIIKTVDDIFDGLVINKSTKEHIQNLS